MVLRRLKPEPQPQVHGLLSLPLPGFGFLGMVKVIALAGVAILAAYRVGILVGDGRGYARKEIEVAKVVAETNARIDSLNQALDLAHQEDLFKREVHSADALQSLKDIPMEVRTDCANRCSLPEATRRTLEKIP